MLAAAERTRADRSATSPVESLAARSIELRHLRYFVAVTEEGHFTRAAARLHMAQPPLSAQIRQLERRVGAILFDRSPGRVSLTPAGEALLDSAYATLAAVDDGIEAVRAVAAGRRGRVRVAIGATVPLDRALAAVGALARRAPDVSVDVIRAEAPERLVAQGRVDVAFVRGPLRDRSLSHAVVETEARVALVPAVHRLARAEQATVAELLDDELLEPRDGAIGAGRPTDSIEELLARVAAGRAVAVVPRGLVGDLAPEIAVVRLRDALPSPIVIAHRGEAAGPATATYIAAVLGTWRSPDALISAAP
jgi:DNA-binding transcriptional LysR family regulator